MCGPHRSKVTRLRSVELLRMYRFTSSSYSPRGCSRASGTAPGGRESGTLKAKTTTPAMPAHARTDAVRPRTNPRTHPPRGERRGLTVGDGTGGGEGPTAGVGG